HYAMTLDEWLRRFEANKTKVLKMYDEKFYRMWSFYLASSSAAFRYGDISLSQFVFSKGLNNNLPLTREYLYK
ncbi:MAG: class I SAM-dependent methyltransferase, partial [Candidatus Saccharimonadales bacterium]